MCSEKSEKCSLLRNANTTIGVSNCKIELLLSRQNENRHTPRWADSGVTASISYSAATSISKIKLITSWRIESTTLWNLLDSPVSKSAGNAIEEIVWVATHLTRRITMSLERSANLHLAPHQDQHHALQVETWKASVWKIQLTRSAKQKEKS